MDAKGSSVDTPVRRVVTFGMNREALAFLCGPSPKSVWAAPVVSTNDPILSLS